MGISTKETTVKLLLLLCMFLFLSSMNLSKKQIRWLSFKKWTSKEPTHLALMIFLSIENDGTVPGVPLLPYCIHPAYAHTTLIMLEACPRIVLYLLTPSIS